MIGFDADGRSRLHSHRPAGCLPSHLMLHHVRRGALAGPRCCSMEVDSSPLDERKEGGDDALVQVHDSGDGGSIGSPMQIDHGQMRG